jgi:5-dehydro-2-deoxygluconokinase
MFGFQGELTDEQKAKVTEHKTIIYDAITEAIGLGVHHDTIGVLVDEIFGKEILLDAKKRDLITIQTVEKSGQNEFVCEFGDDFAAHLLVVRPTFAKVLIRYNPSGDVLLNARQRGKLRIVSDMVHTHGIKLLVEPLVIATEKDMELVQGDAHVYDTSLRLPHTLTMMRELQREGIEVDVWKIEGFDAQDDYEKIVEVARNSEARKDVGVIILGRNENKEQVKKWITAGKSVEGVIGFAVGRTIFWEPLEKFRDGTITRDEAVHAIAEGYYEMWNVFTH